MNHAHSSQLVIWHFQWASFNGIIQGGRSDFEKFKGQCYWAGRRAMPWWWQLIRGGARVIRFSGSVMESWELWQCGRVLQTFVKRWPDLTFWTEVRFFCMISSRKLSSTSQSSHSNISLTEEVEYYQINLNINVHSTLLIIRFEKLEKRMLIRDIRKSSLPAGR